MTRLRFALAVTLALLISAGGAVAASQEFWKRNGVLCNPTGTGKTAGVVCVLTGSNKMVVVNQRQIIVGNRATVLYVTSSR